MTPVRKAAVPPTGRAAEPPRESYVFIGVIAKRFGVHPQTLRLYEREGLIRPARSSGNTRLYDVETVERLEIILTLTRELGVNLAGVEVILDLKSRLARMEGEVGRLMEAIRAVARDHAARGGGAARDDKALAVRPRGPIVLKYD
jgi:MerR family transcriptional regulator/heat shock protein HspR